VIPDWTTFQWALAALAGLVVCVKYAIYWLFIRILVPKDLRNQAEIVRALLLRIGGGIVLVAAIFALRVPITRSILTVEGIMVVARPILWWGSLGQLGVPVSRARLGGGIAVGTAISIGYDCVLFLLIMAVFGLIAWQYK